MVQMLIQGIVPNLDQMNWSMQYFRYQRTKPAHKLSIFMILIQVKESFFLINNPIVFFLYTEKIILQNQITRAAENGLGR